MISIRQWLARPKLTRRQIPDTVIAQNEFGKYAIPRAASHRIAARCILDGGVYEPLTVDLLRRECGDGDIIHAGTFFGDFLPALSSALVPGARVYAFEPNPESYECAEMTLALNGIENVVIECIGLSSNTGRDDLITVSANGQARGGASRIVREEDDLEDAVAVEIPISTIDARVPADRFVSVIQLDVEGHEQAALEGALGTLERCRPVIVLESLPDDAWVAENLLPLGYRQAERVHHNTVFRLKV